MPYFAKVENGTVVNVISVDQETINSGVFGDPASWLQTSYNTRGNVHYGPDGLPDSKPPLRGNYAAVGYVYNAQYDVFYAPQPYPSWLMDYSTWLWFAPVPYPNDGREYVWDEQTISWVPINNEV